MRRGNGSRGSVISHKLTLNRTTRSLSPFPSSRRSINRFRWRSSSPSTSALHGRKASRFPHPFLHHALSVLGLLSFPLFSVSWRVMDCQSSHTFDSDESDIDIQTEIYEKGGSIDDIRNDLDFCLRDDDKVAEQSVVDLPMDGVEPYIGMEFSSRDEAREFYVNYGRRVGFTVRIHHNRRSRVNNQVIGQDFVCSKEGFRAKKYVCRKDRILPAPPITREGCQAMMRLALRDGGKWAVTKFVKDHNHLLLSPSKVPWKGSGKNLSEDEKDKRIRELSLELYNERQKYKRKCAAYEEQLKTILKELEMHTECISNKVAEVVKSIREVEEEEESKGLNERWI